MYSVVNGCTVGYFRLETRKRLKRSMRGVTGVHLLQRRRLQVYACSWCEGFQCKMSSVRCNELYVECGVSMFHVGDVLVFFNVLDSRS